MVCTGGSGGPLIVVSMAMSSEQPQSLDTLVDAFVQVAGDVPCIHCSYNLRTLHVRGVCPECGEAVAESLRTHDKDSVEWLGNVADGASTAATILVIEPGLLGLFFVPWVGRSDASCLVTLLVLLGGILLFVMLLRMTTEDPVQMQLGEGVSARRVVRGCLALLPAGVFAFGMAIASNPRALTWVAGAAAIVAGGSVVVLPLALASYLNVLMHRITRPDVAKGARWFFGAAAVAETAAVAVIGLRVSRLWRPGPQDVVKPLLILLALLVLIAACILLMCAARALRAAYLQAKEMLEALEQAEAGELATVLTRAAVAESKQVAGDC